MTAVRIEGLTHGYNGRTLFKDADLVIERGERVAIIGPNGARVDVGVGGRALGEAGWTACRCLCMGRPAAAAAARAGGTTGGRTPGAVLPDCNPTPAAAPV
jgi:ABC-type hemin transport system ATPase subunit